MEFRTLPEEGRTRLLRKFKKLKAVRIVGPFFAHGKHGTDDVQDGWLVADEEGHVSGIEDVNLHLVYLRLPDDFTDEIVALPNAQVGLIYSEFVVPPEHAGALLTSVEHTFGTVPEGLVLDLYDPAAILLSGTPESVIPGWSYFELTFGWADGTGAIQRYCMAVAEEPVAPA